MHGARIATLGAVVWMSLLCGVACGQSSPSTPGAQAVPASQPQPATKLEAFKPAAGSVVTFGYDELGVVEDVSVDVREMRGSSGVSVRGLVVEITESEYRKERSFVDADEVSELLKGIDALLAVRTNPTTFQNFEVRYTTRGELQITAFNSGTGTIRYSVQAGRLTHASSFLSVDQIRQLRSLFEGALAKLTSTPARK